MPRQSNITAAQPYPRIEDQSSQYFNCLDDSSLVQHQTKISVEEAKVHIRTAIKDANAKSGRAILAIKPDDTSKQVAAKYKKAGKDLLKYFARYSIDPAGTAHDVNGKHYTQVGEDLFQRRTLQNEGRYSKLFSRYLHEHLLQFTGEQQTTREDEPLTSNPTWVRCCEDLNLLVIDVMNEVLITPLQLKSEDRLRIIEAFGFACHKIGLINKNGIFTSSKTVLQFLLRRGVDTVGQ